MECDKEDKFNIKPEKYPAVGAVFTAAGVYAKRIAANIGNRGGADFSSYTAREKQAGYKSRQKFRVRIS
jgi:hypothetical protein